MRHCGPDGLDQEGTRDNETCHDPVPVGRIVWRQPLAQAEPAARQPAFYGPDRAAKDLRSFLLGVALEIAEHQRSPEPQGKPIEFLVDQGSQVARLGPPRADLGRRNFEHPPPA